LNKAHCYRCEAGGNTGYSPDLHPGAGDAPGLRETEREIDQIVYRLYDLTPAEIAQIEGALANTRRGDTDDDDEEEDGA